MRELLSRIRFQPGDTVWLTENSIEGEPLNSVVVDHLSILVISKSFCHIYYYTKGSNDAVGFSKIYLDTNNVYQEESTVASSVQALDLAYTALKKVTKEPVDINIPPTDVNIPPTDVE